MKQEEKSLLLQDLCARLPYGIICKYWAKDYANDCGDYINEYEGKLESICLNNREVVIDITCVDLDTDIIKPYLRPMSSMTEEQEIEYDATFEVVVYEDGRKDSVMTYKSFDWLNKNNFDYRGLIPMGLAIEVTEENNPYKD